jgi:hypothetical protein
MLADSLKYFLLDTKDRYVLGTTEAVDNKFSSTVTETNDAQWLPKLFRLLGISAVVSMKRKYLITKARARSIVVAK